MTNQKDLRTALERAVFFFQQFRQANFGDCPEAPAAYCPETGAHAADKGSWFDTESASLLAALTPAQAPDKAGEATRAAEEIKAAFNDAAKARDEAGYVGTPASCIQFFAAEVDRLEKALAALTPTPPLSPDSAGPAGDDDEQATERAMMRIEAEADAWISETPDIGKMVKMIAHGWSSHLKDRAAAQADALVRQTFVEAFYRGFNAHRDHAAALAALSTPAPIAAPVRDDGQPMMSAPKDREILLYGVLGRDRSVRAAWYIGKWSEACGFWAAHALQVHATAWADLPTAPAGDVPGEAQTRDDWKPIAELKPQTNAVIGRWQRCGDNEDGSEFWYWQEATGRWFEHAEEVHWCLRSGRFDQGPFYGETPTHFHPIPEKPARGEAQTQEGGR